jgi:PilZ domain
MLFESANPLPQSAEERRTMRRFDMRLPAIVKLTGDGFHELLTETQNVSARGVYFYVDRKVSPGAKVEITLTLPSHVTLTDAVRVRFTAHVVRVDSAMPASRLGVAALIEKYEFLRSPQASEYQENLEPEWNREGTKAGT